MNENEDHGLTDEEVADIMANPDLLHSYGYMLTPKGCMALVLMTELQLDLDLAEKIASKMDNMIFLQEYIYVKADQIEVVDDVSSLLDEDDDIL